MEAEKVLNLYNWCWFQRQIFEKEPNFSFWSSSEDNPDGENGVEALETISTAGYLSPNSVLPTSKLRSVFSETSELESPKTTPFKSELGKMRRKRKSLSELEYEEVKGFGDLGFVFSEEDRNSSLGLFIPGLHRLGLEELEEEEREFFDESSKFSRPYLSEAWEVLGLDRRREEIKPLLRNWKLPSFRNEVDMKENLRWWAHTVASTVR